LKSFGHNTGGLLFVVATGVCLSAGSLFATENTTSSRSSKPAPHLASSHPATTHSVAKKPGTHSSSAHYGTNRNAVASSRLVHTATGKTTSHTASSGTVKRDLNHSRVYVSQHKGNNVRSRSSRSTRSRTTSSQQRLAHLHLAPERVQEIQQALIRDGYMEGDATGEWDARTRDAMLKFQASHGFPPTGLPEAKSLMKLGLGPHPLPAELDHGEVGVTSAGVTATVQSVFSVSPTTPPGSPASPPNLDTVTPETK
jgi:peptidoglycan hydrolase-like protein with peptidoglycan-binding domain